MARLVPEGVRAGYGIVIQYRIEFGGGDYGWWYTCSVVMRRKKLLKQKLKKSVNPKVNITGSYERRL